MYGEVIIWKVVLKKIAEIFTHRAFNMQFYMFSVELIMNTF